MELGDVFSRKGVDIVISAGFGAGKFYLTLSSLKADTDLNLSLGWSTHVGVPKKQRLDVIHPPLIFLQAVLIKTLKKISCYRDQVLQPLSSFIHRHPLPSAHGVI